MREARLVHSSVNVAKWTECLCEHRRFMFFILRSKTDEDSLPAISEWWRFFVPAVWDKWRFTEKLCLLRKPNRALVNISLKGSLPSPDTISLNLTLQQKYFNPLYIFQYNLLFSSQVRIIKRPWRRMGSSSRRGDWKMPNNTSDDNQVAQTQLTWPPQLQTQHRSGVERGARGTLDSTMQIPICLSQSCCPHCSRNQVWDMWPFVNGQEDHDSGETSRRGTPKPGKSILKCSGLNSTKMNVGTGWNGFLPFQHWHRCPH